MCYGGRQIARCIGLSIALDLNWLSIKENTYLTSSSPPAPHVFLAFLSLLAHPSLSLAKATTSNLFWPVHPTRWPIRPHASFIWAGFCRIFHPLSIRLKLRRLIIKFIYSNTINNISRHNTSSRGGRGEVREKGEKRW